MPDKIILMRYPFIMLTLVCYAFMFISLFVTRAKKDYTWYSVLGAIIMYPLVSFFICCIVWVGLAICGVKVTF